VIEKVLERTRKRGKKTIKEPPSQTLIWIFKLLIVFFIGLVFLEALYIVLTGELNPQIWSGIMTIVGAIIGLIGGRRL